MVTSSDAVRRFLRRQTPGSVLSAGAPGLGWALGAGVGVRLAAPDQTVVALVGDGSFVFGSPVAALWAAQQAAAPFLTLILNNGGYNASKMPVLGLFPDGASKQANAFPGVRFNTPPDYAAVARSCHAYGERVEDPAELTSAIERGLADIRAFYERFGQEDAYAASNEVRVLKRFARDIRKKLPVDPLQRLQRKLERAVKDERYEEAARLRDKISGMQGRDESEKDRQRT